jgi:DNA mismatch endonuclease (patch repair protein)
MSGIRGKDTQPEMRVRRRLHAAGLRYRLHVKELPGQPDMAFIGARTAVFVHGCFWHQHPGCRMAAKPGTNIEFWQAKLRSNVVRDAKVQRALEASGWTVVVVWECSRDDEIEVLLQRLRSSYAVGSPATRRTGRKARLPREGGRLT